MNNTLKKIWNIFSTILVVAVVLCAIFLMGSRLLGYKCYTIISGSMQPTYNVGDLIYVKPVEPETVKVGDPITFVLNEDLVVATHRVVRIDAENMRFYTKGDANEIEDNDPVHFNNLIGVPKYSIPKLGYVSEFIQTRNGMYITIIAGIILVILLFLPDIFAKKKKGIDTGAIKEPSPELDSATKENELLKEELEKLRAEMKDKESE